MLGRSLAVVALVVVSVPYWAFARAETPCKRMSGKAALKRGLDIMRSRDCREALDCLDVASTDRVWKGPALFFKGQCISQQDRRKGFDLMRLGITNMRDADARIDAMGRVRRMLLEWACEEGEERIKRCDYAGQVLALNPTSDERRQVAAVRGKVCPCAAAEGKAAFDRAQEFRGRGECEKARECYLIAARTLKEELPATAYFAACVGDSGDAGGARRLLGEALREADETQRVRVRSLMKHYALVEASDPSVARQARCVAADLAGSLGPTADETTRIAAIRANVCMAEAVSTTRNVPRAFHSWFGGGLLVGGVVSMAVGTYYFAGPMKSAMGDRDVSYERFLRATAQADIAANRQAVLDADAKASSANKKGWISMGIGIGLVAGGVTTLLLMPRREASTDEARGSASTVAFAPFATPNGGGLVYSAVW